MYLNYSEVQASFRKEFLSGTFYIAIAKYAGLASQLVISAILARLLTPSAYGVIAIATVLIAFFNILSDVGIGVAVIQRKDLTDRDLNHLFSVNIYIGVFLSVLFFSASGIISDYYDNEQLLNVCRLLSLLILFTCARTVPMNMFYREKQFKYVAFTNLSAQLISGVAAIFAALAGWGVYALVLSQVMSAFLLLIIYMLKYKRHFYFKVDFSPLKRIFSYSIYNFLSTVFCYFTLNIDKLLVGKYTGTQALGYYEKSYRLVFLPITNLPFVITPVLHPLFSEFQNDFKGLQSRYLKIIQVFAYISFPLSVACFFLAKELIMIFFGDQWGEAVMPFRIMSLAISFLILDTTVGSIFNAANETKRGFYTTVIMSLIMIVSVSVAIYVWNTIIAVAFAFLISKILATLVNFYSLMQGLNSCFSQFLSILIRPFVISAITFAIMLCFTRVCTFDNVIVSLIVKSVVWLITSLVFVQLMSDYNIYNISKQKISEFRNRRNS